MRSHLANRMFLLRKVFKRGKVEPTGTTNTTTNNTTATTSAANDDIQQQQQQQQALIGSPSAFTPASGKEKQETIQVGVMKQVVKQLKQEEQHLQTHMHSSPAPSKVSHKICLVSGYGRSSFGDTRLDGDLPMSVLRSECAFTLSVAMILCEAGEEYIEYVVDMGDKPEWHKDVNPKLETPACRLAGSEEWLGGTDHIIDTLIETSSKVGSLNKLAPPADVGNDKDSYEAHMVAFALCLVHSSPNNIRSFLLNKLGVDPDVDMSRSKAALQAKALEILGRWETALGAGGGVQRPFLCGDRPGLLDCRLVTKLNIAYHLFESGLSDLGAPFAEVAPLTFSYLDRFSRRDSWTKAFGPGREVGTGVLDVVSIRTVSNKYAKMCPELIDPIIIPALAKSRATLSPASLNSSMASSVSSSVTMSIRGSISRRKSTVERVDVAKLCL